MTMPDQASPSAGTPLLEVKNLAQRYTLPRESVFKPAGQVHALNGVTAQVMAGRSLGVVGESGSGKSTFARLVMALEAPSSGSVSLMGRDLHRMPADELRVARRDFQMVFQDPYGSLDPRQTIARIVAEPLTALGRMDRATLRQRVAGVLRQVGLRDADMDKFPHEFSGGQRQRIAIARVMLKDAPILLLDEATSALDSESETLVQRALDSIMQGRTTLVIAHRLATVTRADRILVLDQGQLVEEGTHQSLLGNGGIYSRLAELQFATDAA
jgi:peptide/nickel transport system ATP-binding protein